MATSGRRHSAVCQSGIVGCCGAICDHNLPANYANVESPPGAPFWDPSHLWRTNMTPNDLKLNISVPDSARERERITRAVMSDAAARQGQFVGASLPNPFI